MDLKGRKWEYEIQNIYPWIYLPETSLAVCPGVSVHHTAPGLPLVPLDNNVVVVYHVLIVPMGHKLLKKLWPMVVGCVLRTAGSSLVWNYTDPLTLLELFNYHLTHGHEWWYDWIYSNSWVIEHFAPPPFEIHFSQAYIAEGVDVIVHLTPKKYLPFIAQKDLLAFANIFFFFPSPFFPLHKLFIFFLPFQFFFFSFTSLFYFCIQNNLKC